MALVNVDSTGSSSKSFKRSSSKHFSLQVCACLREGWGEWRVWEWRFPSPGVKRPGVALRLLS